MDSCKNGCGGTEHEETETTLDAATAVTKFRARSGRDPVPLGDPELHVGGAVASNTKPARRSASHRSCQGQSQSKVLCCNSGKASHNSGEEQI